MKNTFKNKKARMAGKKARINEKEFCKSALEQANVPSEVIEELMEGW